MIRTNAIHAVRIGGDAKSPRSKRHSFRHRTIRSITELFGVKLITKEFVDDILYIQHNRNSYRPADSRRPVLVFSGIRSPEPALLIMAARVFYFCGTVK
jgi:hypothetical protein